MFEYASSSVPPLAQAKRDLPQRLRRLTAKSSDDRTEALQSVIQFGATYRSLAQLAKMACRSAATDSHEFVREVAADGLGLLGNRSDHRCLEILLQDESGLVRSSAAQSYHCVGPKLAIPRLSKILFEEQEELVVRYAFFGLLDLNLPERTDPIIDRALTSPAISDYAKEAVLAERLEDLGEVVLQSYLKLLESSNWLAGDMVMWRFYNNPDCVKDFSDDSKTAIIAALQKRATYIESFGWRSSSVEGRQARLRETIERLESTRNQIPPL